MAVDVAWKLIYRINKKESSLLGSRHSISYRAFHTDCELSFESNDLNQMTIMTKTDLIERTIQLARSERKVFGLFSGQAPLLPAAVCLTVERRTLLQIRPHIWTSRLSPRLRNATFSLKGSNEIKELTGPRRETFTLHRFESDLCSLDAVGAPSSMET